MKPIPESPLNKIALLFILSLLLAAGLGAWLTLPPAQAQGGDEGLWRTLDPPFEFIGRVLEDKVGDIWVVSLAVSSSDLATDIQETLVIPGEGLAKYEQGRWITYTVDSTNGELPGDTIHAALFDRAGNLWLAVAANKTISDTVRPADVGVVCFDGQDWQTFTVTNTGGGLASNSVRDIFEDDIGNLWFATLDGLSQYDGKTWEVVADKDDVGAEGVFRVFQDSQNRLWVGLFDFEDGVGVPRGVARSASVGADGAVGGWQTFTEVDGLANDFVLTMAEDGKGNIWLGTVNGASWFDGENWETFNLENSDLPGNIVNQVIAGYEGQMWATTGEGAAKYTGGQWQRYQGYEHAHDIFKDSERLVWGFSTSGYDYGDIIVGSGLRYYTGYHRQRFSKENGDLASNNVSSFLEASDGAIWAGTDGAGVSRYRDGEWQTFSVESGDLGSNHVRDLIEASDGAIWIRTGWPMDKDGGVSRYQDGEWQTFSVESGDLGSNYVGDLFEASDGAIWAETYGSGVSRYQDGQWQTFSVESGDLGSNHVRDLIEASDGAIWARTDDGGVSRHLDGKWQTFSVESGDLASNDVRELFEASDGVIWARTGGGVSRYHGGEWQTFSVESGDLGSNDVRGLSEASDGAIWVKTGGGVSRYQDGQWQTFSVESGDLGGNAVEDLFEASDGAIWARTDDGGVSRYQDGEWQTFSMESGDLGSNDVQGLLETSDGAIWVRTRDGGVSRYQNGEWQTFGKESGDLSSNDVWPLFEASDGAIWVGTDGGWVVSRYQNGQWQTFSVESSDLDGDGLLSCDPGSFLFEASNGTIWAKPWCSEGMSRYQNGEWRTLTYQEVQEYEGIFSQSSRLFPDEPLSLQLQLTDRHGFNWRNVGNGLVRSYTGHRPPWVKIATVNDIPLTGITCTLSYDDRRRVFIGFTSDDLATRPEDLWYRYKLENSPVYADWQVTTNWSVMFDELDPGEYTFVVKAVDEDGNESEPAALDITVEGPPPVPTPLLAPSPEIREVPVEPRYTIPGLGAFTLPQLLGGGMGLAALLGLVAFGLVSWRRQQAKGRPHPLPKEYFNPYIVGKPVTGRNFVGRADIFADLITALKGDNHLIIEGERRIGKTSLLYELAEALRQDGDYCFIPAYVQLQRVTEEKLFYAIMREIARESRRRCGQLPALRCEAPYDDYDTFDAEDDLLTIIEALKEITDLSLRVVILLDEGDRLRDFTEETHSHLRGWMGADIQKDVLILVWCGVSFDRAWHQRTSPWYNQFRSAIEVPPLSSQEAKTLITRPVEDSYEYEDKAIERILTLSQRKPFIIQIICHECVKRIWQEQSGAIIALADVDAVWPLVQRSLESDEQAEAPSEDSILPSLTYPTAAPAEQMAEEAAPYDTQPKETPDDP